MNQHRSLHIGFGLLALVAALVTYLLTAQPSVPFWDCGEFTAAAVGQQVPHPPGAPLFLMLGKVFHMLPFGDPGWRVNLVSVVSSAITVWLLYLITVKVIHNYYREDMNDLGKAISVYGGAFVGAMAFTFSDTFWFNAVESEVYAASTLFVALIVYIMMAWNEHADEVGHERYLLLIAYLIGLSIGVHLLSVLTIFSITLLVYLRKYTISVKGLLITGVLGVVAFAVIYNLIIMKWPALLSGQLPFFKNDAGEFPITDSMLMTVLGVGLIAAAAYGVWYGRKTNHGVLALLSMSFILIVLGYTTYAHILVRANSHTPMNENNPANLEKLVSYLGREQYGEAPTWPRRYQQEDRFVKHYRDYGPWTQPPVKVVKNKDGASFYKVDYSRWKTNTSAEIGYMLDYQMYHMYIRYFLWNFMGRVSDVQDAPACTPFTKKETIEYWNHKNGYASSFPINFYALPLFLGLIGFVLHFARDKRMASVFLILFLMTGVLAALQQNQQNPQPRERDYFYVGSFMVFAMWIGIGAFEIARNLADKGKTAAAAGLVALAMVLVPVNMAAQGWKIHNRAGNYLAFDYAYNILQSVEKDAIIFTNGDNDTFPVWYLQDVAGVRRDVRVVNLSLGQTLWYIYQLKNERPHGALPVPISIPNEQLPDNEQSPLAFSYSRGPAQDITVNVDPSIIAQFTTDQNLINAGRMSWTFKGRMNGGEPGNPEYFFGVQHKLVADIIKTNAFKRPVYFCTSMGDPSWAGPNGERVVDEFSGLHDYLRLEGLAYRICPTPQRSSEEQGINDKKMWASLMNPNNGDAFSTTPDPRLKFRNLANPAVFYDDVHRGYLQNYRTVYMKYANYLMRDLRDTARALKVIRAMNEQISLDQFPVGMPLEYQLGTFFNSANDREGAKKMGALLLKSAESLMKRPDLARMEQVSEQARPAQFAYEGAILAEQWDAAKNYLAQQGDRQRDAYLRYRIDLVDVLKLIRNGDRAGALARLQAMQMQYDPMSPDPNVAEAGRDIAGRMAMLTR